MKSSGKNFLILFIVAAVFLSFFAAQAEVTVSVNGSPVVGGGAEGCQEVFDNDTAYCLTPPQISEGKTSEFIPLLNWLLRFGFYAAGILAMLMIVIGGVQYVAAGAAGNPENVKDATNRIVMALGGLALALSSWLILNTINPNLLNFELNLTGDSFKPLESQSSTNPGGGSSNPGGGQGSAGGGAGLTQYQWLKKETNQYCSNILGTNWLDVESSNCPQPQPADTNACCGLKNL